MDHQRSLSLIELGGGRGTNALCILDFLLQKYPQLYDRTEYTILDSSPTLLTLQRKTLGASQHSDKAYCCEKDLVDIAEGKTNFIDTPGGFLSSKQCFVLGLELLDNLPHDKIRLRNTKVEQAELTSVEAEKDRDGQRYQEVFRPLSDPLLMHVIEAAPTYRRIRRAAWIPSVACGLLRSIQRQHPGSQVLLADFDWLPPSDAVDDKALSFPAEGEPLVTDMNDVDHACYLHSTATATDILYPTNFSKLAAYATAVFPEADITVRKQADFLRSYGPDEVKATSSWLTGYSPLVDDFENCSVLTITTSEDGSGADAPQ